MNKTKEINANQLISLGNNCNISPEVIFDNFISIGNNVTINAGVKIGFNTKIGNNILVEENVFGLKNINFWPNYSLYATCRWKFRSKC